jgi:hypothetical protein
VKLLFADSCIVKTSPAKPLLCNRISVSLAQAGTGPDWLLNDRQLWAETVVREEFEMHTGDAKKPVRAGAATFAAFLTAGVIPLMPFIIPSLSPD